MISHRPAAASPFRAALQSAASGLEDAMTSLLSYLRAGHEKALEGERVLLRPPLVADFDQWAALRAESRDFLQPWEPLWMADELTMPAYRRRLRGYWRDSRAGVALPLFIISRDSHELLGGINMSNIRRGIAQTASIGYWIGQRHARRGYMTDAVTTLVRHAFTEMKLNRVEAACIPENTASKHLLERCGFTREGYARRYLRINGRWRDHLLFAIVREHPEDVDNSSHP